jgi:hypothetical protein
LEKFIVRKTSKSISSTTAFLAASLFGIGSASATCIFDGIEYDCTSTGGDHIHISGSYLSKPTTVTAGKSAWIFANLLYNCSGADCSVTKIFENGNMTAVSTTNPSCVASAFKDGFPYVFGMTFPCPGIYHATVSISTTSGSFFYSYDQNQIASYKETFAIEVSP